ncbi:MAG TPA: DUF4920 domain-containing protein [Polyangiaceae bacterium]
MNQTRNSWRAQRSRLLAALLLLTGCKGAAPAPEPVASAAEPLAAAASVRPATSKTSVHGSAISAGPEVALAKVLANPREFEGKTVTVSGDVRRVCKKMGCWMELATDKSEAAPGCRVFFGAHQFFVPKDSDGSRARVQGEVQVKQVEADFVQHLEQEGASFKAKNADGTADEVRLVATGVELTRG